MNKKNKIVIILSCILITIILGLVVYKITLSPVNKEKKSEEIIVEIPEGYGVSKIADLLKEKNVIKNELTFKIYIKLSGNNNLQAGKYLFENGKEDVSRIVEKMKTGNIYKQDVTITFIEGKNMRNIAKTIAKNTNNTEKDVFNLLKDEEYIDSLIDKYWFLTDEIKDENIYYPLEGYLLPDTYTFENSNVSVKTIFNVILNFTEKYLEQYKNKIEDSGPTIHQILTMASIAELEGKNTEDRAEVIGVFYNRVNAKMSLGSDVTTYYAVKVDMGDRDLTKREIDTYNAYNTRGPKMAGKIPIGPICNPSRSAIEATINYQETDAYYFVADNNGKLYFSKNYEKHQDTIRKLKKADLWYVYE